MMAAPSQPSPEWDLLLSAAQKNNTTTIHKLIQDKNVDPNHSNVVGQSALHIACLWGNIESVQALLQHSAEVNSQNKIAGSTPIHSAVQSTKEPMMNRVQCVRLLVEAGADVYLQDLFGSTPMETLDRERERLGDAMDDGYYSAMKEVLSAAEGQDLALIPLVSNLDFEGVRKKCLEASDDTIAHLMDEREKKTSRTALLTAVDLLTETVKEYLDTVDMEAEDASIKALQSIVGDIAAMIHLLLEKGSDANAIATKNLTETTVKEELTPMYMVCRQLSACFAAFASSSGSAENIVQSIMEGVVMDLKSHGANIPPSIATLLHDASRRGRISAVKFYLERLGLDPNTKGRQGLTALHFAARSGAVSIVKWLVSYTPAEAGHALDTSIVDDRGKTALDAATVNGKVEIIDLLKAASWSKND